MSTHYPNECALVRTVTLRELYVAYLAQRRRPVGASDRDNIKLVFAAMIALFPNATTADFDAEKLEALINFLIRQKSRFRKPYSRKPAKTKGIYTSFGIAFPTGNLPILTKTGKTSRLFGLCRPTRGYYPLHN